MLRKTYNTGKVKWYLQRMSPVEPGTTGYVDTLSSSVVSKGLFSPAQRLYISTEADVTFVGTFPVMAYQTSLDGAKMWIRTWQDYALDIELSAGSQQDCRWFPPTSAPVSALKRILMSMRNFQRPVGIDEIVAQVNDIYGLRVRVNNTWRTIRSCEDLFVVSEGAEVSVSPKGRAWLDVIIRFDEAWDDSA